MKYEVHITDRAEKDLMAAADYIEFILLNPKAAEDLLDEAGKMIGELSDFPERAPLIDDSVLKAWGLRFIVIKNYLAFYVVSREEHRVYVIRFLYKKRDWIGILKQEVSIP